MIWNVTRSSVAGHSVTFAMEGPTHLSNAGRRSGSLSDKIDRKEGGGADLSSLPRDSGSPNLHVPAAAPDLLHLSAQGDRYAERDAEELKNLQEELSKITFIESVEHICSEQLSKVN